MVRIVFIVLVLIFGISNVAPQLSYAQIPERPKTKTVAGAVVDSDWVGSKIVVKWYDDLHDTYDEITIMVPDGTLITKGTSTISFTDIRQDDRVQIEYSSDSFAGLKAARITVQI